jgi:N-acetylmuramoyl-L-alanine amidase-like
MKTRLLILLVLSALISCSQANTKQGSDPGIISYLEEDHEILEQVLSQYGTDKEATTSDLMVKVGSFFLETPYVAHTLEDEDEHLVINLRELDCTTFAENCLAISRTIKSDNQSFGQFCTELQNIRYHDGEIDGYPSRLHYFCDWIYNNEQKKLIEQRSEEIAGTVFPKEINFMSTHSGSYRQLKDSISLIKAIAAQEKLISARQMFFIPEDRIAELESQLMDGDIVGLTTEIEGLDIQHVGILIRREGRIHLMHASSKAEKVVISENTLEEYLLHSKSANGIMLARPL